MNSWNHYRLATLLVAVVAPAGIELSGLHGAAELRPRPPCGPEG